MYQHFLQISVKCSLSRACEGDYASTVLSLPPLIGSLSRACEGDYKALGVDNCIQNGSLSRACERTLILIQGNGGERQEVVPCAHAKETIL